MKKIVSIILLVILSVSCTNQDRSPSVDPTKLALVILSPNTTAEQHWSFYQNGLLKDIKKPDGTVLQQFSYDANGNLVSNSIYTTGAATTNNTFTYDINNRITAVNGKSVTYNQTDNSYTIHNNYTISDPANYDVTGSWKIELNSEFLIHLEHEYYLTSDGNHSTTGENTVYSGNNMTSYYDGDNEDGSYTHDNKINPFKQALLPICKALGIINFRNPTAKWALGEYNSVNNILFNGYDSEGPEGINYVYQYNDNNLPINCVSSDLDNPGVLTTQTLYYYQGDIIP